MAKDKPLVGILMGSDSDRAVMEETGRILRITSYNVCYTKLLRSSSFRCWPLFGWKKKEDWYNKVFVLWPFFSRVQLYLGTDRPTDSWFFLPFYGSQQTPFGKSYNFV